MQANLPKFFPLPWWTQALAFSLVLSIGQSTAIAADPAHSPKTEAKVEALGLIEPIEPIDRPVNSLVELETELEAESEIDPGIESDAIAADEELNVTADPSNVNSVDLTTAEPANLGSMEFDATQIQQGDEALLEPMGISLAGSMDQVTSVSQLSDVQPTDWAFQALQSLVERYGCIAGYPDGTFRGDRALTRYEFAAGLNACLDRVLEITGLDGLTEEDLATIRQLQDEFATELATVRGRVDALEGRAAILEGNQFSTTTKLNGLAFFHVNGAWADGDVLAEGTSVFTPARNPLTGEPVTRLITDDPEVIFNHLVWLNLNTSFTGRDLLNLQLAVGGGVAPANTFASAGLFNTFGVPFTLQDSGDQVILREAFYSFPVTSDIQLTVGPRINWYRHFDNNRFTFFLTGANSFNSSGGSLVNTVDRGAGAVLEWLINDNFELTLGYLGESTEFLSAPLFNTANDPSEGLFGGTYTITAELDFSIGDFTLRGLYTRSRMNAVNGFVGGSLGEPIYGFIDDGFGGPVHDAYADTFLVNFDWLVTDWVGLFGRYTYGEIDVNPVIVSPLRPDGIVSGQSVQLGVAFPDLFKEGALMTFSYLKPFATLDGRNYLVSGGGDGGVQYEFELSYFYPLTSNISLIPSFYAIANPNNFDDNPTIFVGNLQTQFRF